MWRVTWVWLGCAVTLAIVAGRWSGITVAFDGMSVGLSVVWCAALAGAIWVKRRPGLCAAAGPLQALAQLVAISVTCAFLQYAAIRLGRPLIDQQLADFDVRLYFDWRACFAWVLQCPTVLKLLSWVYLSLGAQSVLVCLTAWLDPARASRTIAANALTLSLCLLIFAIWPAAGPFIYYAPDAILSDYIPQFLAARGDPHLSLALDRMTGIISFPSYHAAAAVLFGYAFAALPPWIAAPAIAIEIGLVVSAVLIGGHYLIDVLAGVAIAGGSLAIAHHCAKNVSPQEFGRPLAAGPIAARTAATR